MSPDFFGFSKENVNKYFNELSKEIKREYGRDARVELIVVGGASVLINYNFRGSTMDIDSIVASRSSIKDAVNRVGDKYGLPNGWLNSDFQKTKSYSPKLVQYSKFYRTFNQVLTVRTIDAEYLVAMKLSSLRAYKNDKSDILGILREHAGSKPLDFQMIDTAVNELYGGWNILPEKAKETIITMLDNQNNEQFFEAIKSEEKTNLRLLSSFEEDYQNVLTEDNLDDVLQGLKNRKQSDFVLGNEYDTVIEETIENANDEAAEWDMEL